MADFGAYYTGDVEEIVRDMQLMTIKSADSDFWHGYRCAVAEFAAELRTLEVHTVKGRSDAS